MQIDVPLVNESQLGSRLNRAIEHDRRGEFGLLLSLLSVDARDMAQFQLDASPDVDSRLRQTLDLPAPQTMVANLTRPETAIDNSKQFHDDSLRGFQLQQALNPEALVIRGRETTAMVQTLSNCDPVTQSRHHAALTAPQMESLHFAEQLAMQRQMARTIAAA